MINPRDQYNKQGQHQLWHTHQLWQQQADMPIYSPSLLNHIYDQINLPAGDQQQQQQPQYQQHQQQPYTYGRSATTYTNTSNATSNNYNYTLSLANQNLNTGSSLCRNNSSCNTSSSFRTSARQCFYEYKTIVKYSIALLLLALALLTIIKLTIFTPTSAGGALASATLASAASLPVATDRVHLLERDIDTLESKLIIGEFVILSQNYSHVDSQRALLADRIVKLMDQWILASEFRPNYSRMEVTSIRPNRPSGIIVGCNIILNESIGFAAPLFGTALYNSLVKNHDRLANMPNYIIDKNSIKFSTVPDNDIRRGIVPTALLPSSVSRDLAPSMSAHNSLVHGPTMYEPEPEPEPSSLGLPSLAPKLVVEPKTVQDPLDSLNLVVWSTWSSWSSCVDKNGQCDSGRIHSRLRTCNHQITGEKVDANQCKQRFNTYDLELELEICARTCQMQQQPSLADSRIQSDAPSASLGPQTAPSVMFDPYMSQNNKPVTGSSILGQLVGGGTGGNSKDQLNLQDLYTPASAASSTSLSEDQMVIVSTSTERQPLAHGSVTSPLSTSDIMADGLKMTNMGVGQLESQLSCSNCTSDEICLLLINQKVPFCAKMKERQDETGCGGWCKEQNQICQPVGQNAFKCIHDSECLPHEWRCHDSQCIPEAKRCDGHSNCYDSSDERGCPSA